MKHTSKMLRKASEQRVANANITQYQHWLGSRHGLRFENYEALWQWSVKDLDAFWGSIWEYFDIKAYTPYKKVLGRRDMPHAQWFDGATLNYAEHLLLRANEPDASTHPALIFESETCPAQTVTWQALSEQTGSLIALLREHGIESGDPVCSYMPNIPQTVSAMLATTGAGAIWSSCSPDMGAAGVLDRFRQIEPVALFVVDGYRYGGKDYDRRDQVLEMVRQLSSVRLVVFVPYLNENSGCPLDQATVIHWNDAIAAPQQPQFEPVPFAHPLWIVY